MLPEVKIMCELWGIPVILGFGEGRVESRFG